MLSDVSLSESEAPVSSLIPVTTGTHGAVRSIAFGATLVVVFPAESVIELVIVSQSTGSGSRSHEKSPLLSTIAVQLEPLGVVSIIVVFGSAVPVTGLPCVGESIVGSAGAAVSIQAISVALELFPAGSVEVAVIFSPSTGVGLRVQE